MFFILSKVAWSLVSPINLLVVVLVVASLSSRGRRGWAGHLALVASLVLFVIGFLPVAALLLRPLEDRFPRLAADAPTPIGIIVLGGSTDTVISAARDTVALNEAATRMTAAVELSRRYPDARLVFSGGSGLLFEHGNTEAADARRLWIGLGVAPGRITTEDRSRNTYENALFTRRLIEPKPGERWLLVTSAYHMPRAVGLFRAVGIPVVPYPVDYLTSDRWTDFVPPRDVTLNFRRFNTAMREWVGLIVYRLTGRIHDLFPGP